MDNFFIYLFNCLPGLATGVVAGIVILVLEYRTNWFAKLVPGQLSTRKYPDMYTRRRLMDWIEGLFLIVIIISVGGGLIYVAVTTDKTRTVLNNLEDPNTSSKTVPKNGTRSFFNNELFITVENTYRGKCSFIVGAPGQQNQKVSDAGIGHTLVYAANPKYEVRVTGFGDGPFTYTVDFIVTKLPPGQ